MDFQGVPLWDIPDTYSTVTDEDFLALLSKEFPIQHNFTIPPSGVLDSVNVDPDGVNPQSLTTFIVPGHATPPLTDDSSPSPPASTNDLHSASRRQSGAFTADGDGLKRKASDEDLDDDSAARKNPATDPSRKITSTAARAARKPGGHVSQKDEVRLARRKEQNRAAQRAFRERKEKHVKDLEDRVAELEDAQREKESENDNLRDLLHRLQEENQVLKRQSFTFQVSRDTQQQQQQQQQQAQQQPQPSSSSAGPSTSQFQGSSGQQHPPAAPQAPPVEIDWASLTTFDPAALSILDEPQDVNMDFAGSAPATSRGPYKTIAANPMFMSFAEPFNAWDVASASQTLSSVNAGSSTNSSPESSLGPGGFPAFNSFGSWTGGAPGWTPPGSQGGTMGSLDDLFGLSAQTMDFTQSPTGLGAVMGAPAASSASSSASSPNFGTYGGAGHSPGSLLSSPGSTELSSPPSSAGSPALEHGSACPRTKAEFAARIASEVKSPFATLSAASSPASSAPSPTAPGAPGSAIKKTRDGTQITCSGSVFPQTEKSPHNIEVLAAWRDITSDPKFKDADINELCAEFTNKAKCDGTKVVLDRQGVEEIKNKFSRK